MADELSDLLAGQKYQTQKLEKIEATLLRMDGAVRSHEVRLTVLENFCGEQVKPALDKLVDLRIDMAKWAALGGSIGTVAAVFFAVGKLLQWW